MQSTDPTSDDRRATILMAALQVFARYGYKKTSMEEVARAAGLSRQGLYLHYKKKDELFRAGVFFLFERFFAGAKQALASAAPLEDRLVDMFDAWHGQSLELFVASPYLNELIETGRALAGEIESESGARFVAMLTKVISTADPDKRLAKFGLSASDVAKSLHVTSQGLKHSGITRKQYLDGMRTAVRLVTSHLVVTSPKKGRS